MWWKNIQKRDDAWQRLRSQMTAGQVGSGFRVLILAAHPDDEVLGACSTLIRCSDVHVAYLTDGAPRDPRFRPSRPALSLCEYARLRQNEATAALKLRKSNPATHYFGAVDQEAVYRLVSLVEHTSDLLRRICPDAVITHSYEGGHPDHDAAALVAATAVEHVSNQNYTPLLLEMTSYHAQQSAFRSGSFLQNSEPIPELELWLPPQELAIKQRMLACHDSQRDVITNFQIQPERLRIAPHYDFSQPPHSGPLWYECMNWPLNGRRWRELACAALTQLQMDAHLCR